MRNLNLSIGILKYKKVTIKKQFKIVEELHRLIKFTLVLIKIKKMLG
jgi:hypothetical protein